VTIIVLGSGPLGFATNPKVSLDAKAAKNWLDVAVARGDRIVIPEIADYELRRELTRAGKLIGLDRLDSMIDAFEYLPSPPRRSAKV
jgi:hypothetical protein